MMSPSLRAFLAVASLAAAVICAPVSPASAQSGAGAPEQRAGSRAPASTAAQSRAGIAGRYAPLREGGKDTGCMITLEPSGKAQLAPACRDQGLVIFDPVNWRMEQGRLSLTARKGHRAHFERQGDGTWLRDPKEGKALSLRPI